MVTVRLRIPALAIFGFEVKLIRKTQGPTELLQRGGTILRQSEFFVRSFAYRIGDKTSSRRPRVLYSRRNGDGFVRRLGTA